MNVNIANLNILIYGLEPPKIGFTQSPNGNISLRVDNDSVVKFNPQKPDLTWYDLYPQNWILRERLDNERLKAQLCDFTRELSQLCQSAPEKKFLENYISDCLKFRSGWDAWNTAALIPQLWVNWIHYDAKDPKRAERAQKEPFRVDFGMKHKDIHDDLVIIEIDGPSHFGDYRINASGQPILSSSMDSYTKHIQKDRWLRNQGWKVFRITSQEIEEVTFFPSFFNEVFGKSIMDDIPF